MLTLLPVLFGSGLDEVLPGALFWGSAGAARYMNWPFQKQKGWPLYDNLRLPRYVLLGCLFLGVQPIIPALAVFL